MTHLAPPTLDASTRRRFGRTGLAVSPLGFGGAPIGNLRTEQPVVDEILNTLLDHGVNLIDTAHAYRGSEAAIGAAIGHRRDEYVLVSKCGSKFEEDDLPAGVVAAYVQATIDRSLQRLRTDHIDVMLLHSCDLDVLERGEVLEAVIAAREAGKVRFAGYSGDNAEVAWAAQHPEIAVVQTSLSICDQANVPVLEITRARDVGVMAKRPVANAAWRELVGAYERYRPYQSVYRERFPGDVDRPRRRPGRRPGPSSTGRRSRCGSRSACPESTRRSWGPSIPAAWPRTSPRWTGGRFPTPRCRCCAPRSPTATRTAHGGERSKGVDVTAGKAGHGGGRAGPERRRCCAESR